jgi:hypothetical protein
MEDRDGLLEKWLPWLSCAAGLSAGQVEMLADPWETGECPGWYKW